MFGRCACFAQTLVEEGSSHPLFSEWTFWSYPELWYMNVNIRCLLFNVFNSDFLNLTYRNRSCSGTPKNKWPYLRRYQPAAVLAQVPWELLLFRGDCSWAGCSASIALNRLLGSVDVRSGGWLCEDVVAFSNSESEIQGAVQRVELVMESRDFNAFVPFG